MAKVGEVTVAIPQGIEVVVEGKTVTVKKGDKALTRAFSAPGVTFLREGDAVKVLAKKVTRRSSAVVQAMASHIRNLVTGVEKGYEYRLEVVYSHFPMNIAVKGDVVEIVNLGGGKYPLKARIIGKTRVEVKGKDVVVKGLDKEDTGQTAANIERAARIRGKDKRVFQDGIYLVQKGMVQGAQGEGK